MASSRRTVRHDLVLSALVPVALLMGPITWDHYCSWMVVPLMVGCDPDIWSALSGPSQTRWRVVGALSALLLVLLWKWERQLPDAFLSQIGPVALLGLWATGLALLRAHGEGRIDHVGRGGAPTSGIVSVGS